MKLLSLALIVGTWALALGVAWAVTRRCEPPQSELGFMAELLSILTLGCSGSIIAVCA